MSEAIKNRYEFVFYFDVENGNPNGDPDAGNMPRIDPQTGHGIVTDVCLKRKVRNYIEFAKEGEEGFDIYVTEGAILNAKHQLAYEALGFLKNEEKTEAKDGKKNEKPKMNRENREKAGNYMCSRYFDVRTFGAVMDTGDYQCGQIRGPVQLCFSRSVDEILQQEVTITRMAATKEDEKSGANRTMGRKYVVPYALYRAEGFISAKFAQKTGFSEADLELFWTALINMFEQDRSAARGKMAARKLIVFRHESELGNAPAVSLFETVKAERVDGGKLPRAFSDYTITTDAAGVPEGVELFVKL
jgi:CRISPR-associated protein Csd2